MAAGRPVILAIDGVIRELVEQAGAGLFVPPGDPAALAEAITLLAGDPSAGRAMGGRGRQTIEAHFDRAALAEKLATLMEQIAGL
jgi:glycosyltransferase involved in cell wall biosynthesis